MSQFTAARSPHRCRQGPDLLRARPATSSGRGAASPSRLPRHQIDQGRADHGGIGEAGDLGRLLGLADAEADRHRQVGLAADPRRPRRHLLGDRRLLPR